MTGPVSIAIVLKGYPRLSETFIAQEMLALEQAGFTLEIASLRHPTDDRRHAINDAIQAPVRYLPEYLRDEPKRVLLAIIRWLHRPSFWRAARIFLRDYRRDRTVNRIRRFGQAAVLAAEMPASIQWIYAHFIHTPGSVARYAAIMRRLPVSFSAHAKDIWTIPEWEIREKLAAGEWTVCCTESYTAHLRQLAPQASIHRLYHGLDVTRFDKVERADRADAVLHIVCVARAVDKKGIDTLLRALAGLPDDMAWRLSHIGGGPDQERLAAMARELAIDDHVAWLGARAQSEVLALLRAGDLFCLPARLGTGGDRDGLPNALMEALSQGLPVIATAIGGIEELVDANCGIVLPPDRPDLLTQAIVELGRDPDRRRRMGEAGRARIERDFAFQANIGQLIARFRRSLAP